MDNLIFAVVALCARWLEPRHNAQIQFLQAQARMLRARVKSERIILNPTERAELLRLGGELDHCVGDLLHVVKPEAYRRWRLGQARGQSPKGVGRPQLAQEVQDLVVRFATENASWGYRRIVGELRKLGHAVSASAARGNPAGARRSPIAQEERSRAAYGVDEVRAGQLGEPRGDGLFCSTRAHAAGHDLRVSAGVRALGEQAGVRQPGDAQPRRCVGAAAGPKRRALAGGRGHRSPVAGPR